MFRNITQYKPKGTSSIFAPVIDMNGKTYSNEKIVGAPCGSTFITSGVKYPKDNTITSIRQKVANDSSVSNNFNELYTRLFSNLFKDIEDQESLQDFNSLNNDNSTDSDDLPNDELLKRLQHMVQCYENGNICADKDKCPSDKKLGSQSCLLENSICCKQDTSNTGSTTTSNTGSTTTGSTTTSNTGSTTTGSTTTSNTGSTTSGSRSNVGFLLRGKLEDNKKQTKEEERTELCNRYCKRMLKVKSISKESDNFNYKTGDLKYKIEYEWMTCTPLCKEYKCNNCVDTTSYKNPNKMDGKNIDLPDPDDINDSQDRKIVIDYLKSIKKYDDKTKTSIQDLKIKPNLYDSNMQDKCYGLGMNDCNKDKDCFYCNSSATSKKCYKNGDKYICDNSNLTACMPIVNVNDKLEVETNLPFHRDTYRVNKYQGRDVTPEYENKPYVFRKEKIDNKMGQVLDYPRKCQGTIKRTLSVEDSRSAFYAQYRPNA